MVRVSAEEFTQILSLEYVKLVNGLGITPLILKVHKTYWALKIKTRLIKNDCLTPTLLLLRITSI